MKKFLSTLICSMFIASLTFAQRESGLTGRFIPSNNHTLLFCGQNNKDNNEFVKINKQIPAGFMIYTSLKELQGLDKNADYGTGKMSGKYVLKKYKKTALQIGLYLVNSLEEVIDGSLDENIKKFGLWIKKINVPVFLRIGYEFDLPENNYDPELYKQAFRYIVEKFDEQNVTNVSYVWHSYASYNPRGIELWYPGDEYVDWYAITYFANPQWVPMLNFSKQHDKPLMIAECAPTLTADLKVVAKGIWYKKLFRFIDKYDIKAFCYINANWDKQPMFSKYNWGNSKLNTSKEIKNFWLKNIKDERFINADNLYNEIKFNCNYN